MAGRQRGVGPDRVESEHEPPSKLRINAGRCAVSIKRTGIAGRSLAGLEPRPEPCRLNLVAMASSVIKRESRCPKLPKLWSRSDRGDGLGFEGEGDEGNGTRGPEGHPLILLDSGRRMLPRETFAAATRRCMQVGPTSRAPRVSLGSSRRAAAAAAAAVEEGCSKFTSTPYRRLERVCRGTTCVTSSPVLRSQGRARGPTPVRGSTCPSKLLALAAVHHQTSSTPSGRLLGLLEPLCPSAPLPLCPPAPLESVAGEAGLAEI